MITLSIMISALKHAVGRLLRLLQNSFVFLQSTSRELLTITDHRTGRYYSVPIAHNAIQALHLKAICAGNESTSLSHAKNGLRVLDPGFRNTAVMMSRITLV